MVIIAALTLTGFKYIKDIYLNENTTFLGIVLNLIIIALFIIGLFCIFNVLRHYSFEEEQLNIYIKEKSRKKPSSISMSTNSSIMTVSSRSIRAKRYFKIEELYEKKTPINHSALTSILLTEESAYLNIPKFVNNTLILLGVFGTILSLILALTGASNILGTYSNEGMQKIISSMNTKFTTTISAIVCFVIYTFFYHKLLDAQSLFFSRLEDITLTHIIPDFSFDTDTINMQTEALIKELNKVTVELQKGVQLIEYSLGNLKDYTASHSKGIEYIASRQPVVEDKLDKMVKLLDNMTHAIVKGFRLDK
ncbi:hypothetical protein MCHI_001785 [Candidatus Magnetoovum chiemensis]|nr:hypothetical protein MCHI_001785 [Candidatus Magnetoovum chiemensis]